MKPAEWIGLVLMLDFIGMELACAVRNSWYLRF